jgi:hypothetical protein
MRINLESEMKTTLLVAMLLAAATGVAAEQLGNILDLTVFHASSEPIPNSFGPKPGGPADHTQVDSPPLRVTLLEFDRASYQLNDPFVYRLRITNVGKVPFTIPWEPDWTRIGDAPERRIASCFIELVIGPEPLSPNSFHVIDTVVLYGSEAAPGTLKRLAAGETVELVIPNRWHTRSDVTQAQLASLLPRTLPVSAVLSFPRPVAERSYRPLVSPSKAVELEPFTFGR